MLWAMPLSRPKPPQAGAEGQPLQGHRSRRPLPPKVSGPPLGGASTLGHRAKSTASAWEIHPLKIQKSPESRHLRKSDPPIRHRDPVQDADFHRALGTTTGHSQTRLPQGARQAARQYRSGAAALRGQGLGVGRLCFDKDGHGRNCSADGAACRPRGSYRGRQHCSRRARRAALRILL